MWSITSYYNPVHYRRRLENYRIFRANLSTPLITVELSFDGNFELAKGDADILVQISGGATIWQKERLLNVAIKSVPPEVKNVAWLDCDIIFERPDWVDAANEKLANANIVQLYSELVDLPQNFKNSDAATAHASTTARGAVSALQEEEFQRADIAALLQKGRAAGGLSMGLAWAARRDILERQGLYDAMIIGAGDRLLMGTVFGQMQKMTEIFDFNSRRKDHYLNWALPFFKSVDKRIDYVAGRLFHLWHGDLINRKTLERHGSLARLDFEPQTDLVVGTNGAWHWRRPRPDLESFFVSYFETRAEDG